MTTENDLDEKLNHLHAVVQNLLQQHSRLQKENALLLDQLRILHAERAENRERNQQVKQKIQRMITHLRTIGQQE